MDILKSASTLIEEYPDFIPIVGVAIDIFLTVLGAGNLFLIEKYEQHSWFVYCAHFHDVYIFTAGTLFMFILCIVFFSALWRCSNEYGLKREYLAVAISALLTHIYGATTWFNNNILDMTLGYAYERYMYTHIGSEITKILVCILIVLIIVNAYNRRKNEWL